MSANSNSDLSDHRGDRHYYAVSSGGMTIKDSQAPPENRNRNLAQVCENTFDRVQETCLAVLNRSEDFGVVRRTIGVLSEVDF